MPQHDYSDHQPTASGDSLAQLAELADLYATAKEHEEILLAEYKKAKARACKIVEEDIPEIMTECGLTEFKTASGRKITIKDEVHANISQANVDAAHEWLEEHGHGGIVKRDVVVSFNKDQEEEAKEAAAGLRANFPAVKVKSNIHSSTLKAWVSSRLREGEEIPPSITYEKRPVAKVK